MKDEIDEIIGLSLDINALLTVSKAYCEVEGLGDMYIMLTFLIDLQNKILRKLDDFPVC